jgi:hypothetical protein
MPGWNAKRWRAGSQKTPDFEGDRGDETDMVFVGTGSSAGSSFQHRQLAGDAVQGPTLYAAFQRACVAAKIVDCRWHNLRHTFASHCVMAGVDLATVKELLGHHSLEMTMRYSHLAPAHKAAAVAKLAAALQLRSEALPQVAAAGTVLGSAEARSEPKAAPDPARFRHVFFGRQTLRSKNT